VLREALCAEEHCREGRRTAQGAVGCRQIVLAAAALEALGVGQIWVAIVERLSREMTPIA
jgi:hypothetical protein